MAAQSKYVAPEYGLDAYHCPRCGVFARQHWYWSGKDLGSHWSTMNYLRVSQCSHCTGEMFWLNEECIHPYSIGAPAPNVDLPADIVVDYEEAAAILGRSPRGAAALLRLAIQKLCTFLDEPGRNINDDIKSLVAKGLPEPIQQALDVVRVVGNDSVHPGQIDLNDDRPTANRLFDLVNMIAQRMITEPRETRELYERVVPESKREAIEKRDGKALPKPESGGTS